MPCETSSASDISSPQPLPPHAIGLLLRSGEDQIISGPARDEKTSRNPVYTNLTQVIQFPDRDQKFWWIETASIIGDMMERANYDIHLQYFYLLLYHSFIIPALGPRPAPNELSRWKSFMTDDHSPIELSWNFSKDRSLVRFSIEPIGKLAGTAYDPFNQRRALETLDKISKVSVDLDLQWFIHFVNAFWIMDHNAEVVRKGLPEGEHASQVFLGFDFDNGKASTKAYFMPIAKAADLGILPLDLVSQAITGLDSSVISVSRGWKLIEDYIRSIPLESQPKIEIIGLDCVEPGKSRIKLYLRSPYTAFEKVKDVFTLGGRLNDETTRTSVGILEQLWRLVLGLSDDVLDRDELKPRSGSGVRHRTGGTLFNFEIKAGVAFPVPKVYIPVRHYARSDLDVAQGLSTFFHHQRWSYQAQSYMANMIGIFGHHPLGEATGVHTYITFAFKEETGIYLTAYYNPQIYARRKKVIQSAEKAC